ncbi:BRO-N domain-containing protein [Falsiroseomonas tokyonensis]|uniref:Bro-N domain-containing protein n=1 Tax=Falsiroseomonas tokyonensis TaxID=430521 RepID=A0ABV7C0M5_9PROT|nr:Bro-N domain-containing protein [Falsiroseomonas tokyonensis]MBU8540812.1 Bro-N domain-containing protein [Falsiroseomonas tokyonensis]
MTENKITPFLFEGEAMVRVLEREGAPWFVAADVCRALGISDVSTAVAKLDDDEKGTASTRTLGGEQDVLVVSEGGLYTLILRSRDATKPGTVAHRFRKWVTGEVLPAIRRNGFYVAAPVVEEVEEQTPDGLKLRKVNTAVRCFGERAGAQLWAKLGLDWVPAMAHALRQPDLLDSATPPAPGSVTITVTPTNGQGGTH